MNNLVQFLHVCVHNMQGLSQKFSDKLKIKETENVFDKVDLFYLK